MSPSLPPFFWKYKFKNLFFTFAISTLFVNLFANVTAQGYLQLEEGAYATYRIEATIEIEGRRRSDAELTLKWEIIEVEAGTAVISVEMNGTGINADITIRANLKSRKVETLGGKAVGTTCLWIGTDLMEGDYVTVYSSPLCELNPATIRRATTRASSKRYNVWWVESNGTYLGAKYKGRLMDFIATYDVRSGILISAHWDLLGPVFTLMEIGDFVVTKLELTSTNVETSTIPDLSITTILTYVIFPLMVFTTIIGLLLWNRRTRQRKHIKRGACKAYT